MFLPFSTHPIAKEVRGNCLKEGVPPEMLEVDRMIIKRERVLGAGNQTLQMAIVEGIQKIRPNLGPDAQREADHLYILALSGRADLAERMAPLKGQTVISGSMHDAQLATERLMRNLPFIETPTMVPEDYVKVWLADLEMLVGAKQQQGGMADAPEIMGFQNMAKHIGKFIELMGQNEGDQERIRGYQQRLAQIMNLVKAFAQRLGEMMKAQAKNGRGNGLDPKAMVQAQLEMQRGQLKLRNASQSHAQKTAQRQIAFELEQQRQDRELEADIRRKHTEQSHELALNATRAFQE